MISTTMKRAGQAFFSRMFLSLGFSDFFHDYAKLFFKVLVATAKRRTELLSSSRETFKKEMSIRRTLQKRHWVTGSTQSP